MYPSPPPNVLPPAKAMCSRYHRPGKNTPLQVVEDDLDGPVGGVPYLRVVAALGVAMWIATRAFLKMEKRPLRYLLKRRHAAYLPVFLPPLPFPF